MTTYIELIQSVSRDLFDPSNLTFTVPMVKDFIRDAYAEVSRPIPELFQEDITPVEGQLDYPLRQGVFDAVVPEIELKRVELWDGSATPAKFIGRMKPVSEARVNSTMNGWELWNGTLTVTNAQLLRVDPEKHLWRVWGYSPWAVPVDNDDVLGVSGEVEMCLRIVAAMAGLKLLNNSRELYSQWQTRSNNSDISPAGLMNALSLAQDAWRRKARELRVIRELS